MQLTGLEQGLLYTAFGVFAAATLVALRLVSGRREGAPLRPMIIAGTAVLTLLLVVLSIRQGAIPGTNRTEALFVAAWTLSIGAGLIDLKLRNPILLVVTAPTMGILLGFGVLLTLRSVEPGPGAMHPGVIAHILLAVMGLAAFTFAAGVGAYYLWQIKQLKTHPKFALSRKVPPLEVLDRLNFGAVAFGFPFLALSVLGVWLFSSRAGRLPGEWYLDPTVLVTLGGLLVYLALFTACGAFGWRGRRIAWLTVAGFVFIVVGLVVAAFCTSPGVMHAS